MDVEWKYLIGEGLTKKDFNNYIKECFEMNGIKVLKHISISKDINSLCLSLSCDCDNESALDEKVYDLISGIYETSKQQNKKLVSKLGNCGLDGDMIYVYSLGGTVPKEYMLEMTFFLYPNAGDIILTDMLVDDF